MQPTDTSRAYDTPLSTMWFGDDGIFYSITKKDVVITKEGLIDSFRFIQERSGGKMICWIGDISQATFPTQEARDYAGEETPKFIKALALVTNSEISKLIANVFIALKKPPYPTKMFTNEKDAETWIRQFL
ncbi:MAG: hypothetical protein ACHQFW_07335 [Chitinophagales bacterium]